ncbi:MAG: indolepyruvate oxidoreductase subunit beta family protein [Chloroflexota bacterium]
MSVLLGAVGGQGANVLADWIVTAATLAGYPTQSVAMPGLAQRGGQTSLYIEIGTGGPGRYVFSQYPFPGQVDVIIGQEFLEAGRLVQAGYGSSRAKIIASTHRLFTITEKVPMWDGQTEYDKLDALARQFSSQFIGFDALALAKRNGLDDVAVNAILLGALAGSRALPIEPALYERAISEIGVAADLNLKAFHIGLQQPGAASGAPTAPARPRLDAEGRLGELQPALADRVHSFDPVLWPTLVEAVAQLADYQDVAHANLFLDWLVDIARLDTREDRELTRQVARHLAPLMTYEDVIRVAEFKTRATRYARIRAEQNVGPGDVYQVYDYFDPDYEEMYGLLPAPLVMLFHGRPRYKDGDRGQARKSVPFKANTTSLAGAFPLWCLTRFRSWRPRSYRFAKERNLWLEYLRYVHEFVAVDYRLGVLVATTGQMMRGYGRVRRRSISDTRRFIRNVVAPLAQAERKRDKDFTVTLAAAQVARKMLGADETGIDRAEALAADVARRLEHDDPALTADYVRSQALS